MGSQNSGGIQCHNCNGFGHIARNCPNRSATSGNRFQGNGYRRNDYAPRSNGRMSPVEEEVKFGEIGKEETSFRVRCTVKEMAQIREGLKQLQDAPDNGTVDLRLDKGNGYRAVAQRVGDALRHARNLKPRSVGKELQSDRDDAILNKLDSMQTSMNSVKADTDVKFKSMGNDMKLLRDTVNDLVVRVSDLESGPKSIVESFWKSKFDDFVYGEGRRTAGSTAPMMVMPSDDSGDSGAPDHDDDGDAPHGYEEYKNKITAGDDFVLELRECLRADYDDVAGEGWHNKTWLKALAKQLKLRSVAMSEEICAERKAQSLHRLATACENQKMRMSFGEFGLSKLQMLYRLQTALRDDVRVGMLVLNEWTIKTGGATCKSKYKRWVQLQRQVLSLIRIILLLVAPENLQQKKAASLVRMNLGFSLFMSCVSEDKVDTAEFGFATYYMWFHSSIYGGISFNYGNRDSQHLNKGQAVCHRQRGDDKSSTYKRAMNCRLYRMMRIFGVEQFDDVAVMPLHVSVPETVSYKIKKKLITQLERTENHYNRWIGCKFNDRGMQHKKRHSKKKGKAQRMRQRGTKKADVWLSPTEECKWHLAHLSRHERDLIGGHIVHHFCRSAADRQLSLQRTWQLRQRLAIFKVSTVNSCGTVNMLQLLDGANLGRWIDVEGGCDAGTNMQHVEGKYGESVVMSGDAMMKLSYWKKVHCKAGMVLTGRFKLIRLKVHDSGAKCGDIKTVMRWARSKKKNWPRWRLPSLLGLYGWLNASRHLKTDYGEFVRKRIRQQIRLDGGQVAPKCTMLKIPAGVNVIRSAIRAWFCKLIHRTKSWLPHGEVQRWKDSLSIVQSRGHTLGDMLINGPAQCRRLKFKEVSRERCSCQRYPELVEVMKRKHPKMWAQHGHIHMPAADVPWDERDICSTSMKSEVVGGSNVRVQQAEQALLGVLRKTLNNGQEYLFQMECDRLKNDVQVTGFKKRVDRCFLEHRVYSLKKQLKRGAGLVADTWDRDLGRLGLTCPFLHDQFGREAFVAAGSKLEWQQWDVETHGARPEYWLVQMSINQCLMRWELEYQRMNRELCDNRWMPWKRGSRGINCTWIYKSKDISRLRKIFGVTKDPCRCEMSITAKCVALVASTVGTDDFSMVDCKELVEFLGDTEEELGGVYGSHTCFKARGTDFKCYFPSNTKESVIGALEEANEMIADGYIKAGCRQPRGQWMSVPVNNRGMASGKAVWGRYKQQGWVCRKSSDTVQFLKYRSEVASGFVVGDCVLESPEVIIGEPPSPPLCDLAAKLNEHKFLGSLSMEDKSVFRSKRYCDDGCDIGVYDPCRPETLALLEDVMEKHNKAYPGIEVTHEGSADAVGGSIKMLEYVLGVDIGGGALTWYFNNKNAHSVFNSGIQKLLKLRHWRSGTYSRKLLDVVKSRLLDMVTMTKAQTGQVGGKRGSGDLERDVRICVWEFLTELHCCLQYPLKSLLQCIKRLAQTSVMWSKIVGNVMQIKEMLGGGESHTRRCLITDEGEVSGTRHRN